MVRRTIIFSLFAAALVSCGTDTDDIRVTPEGEAVPLAFGLASAGDVTTTRAVTNLATDKDFRVNAQKKSGGTAVTVMNNYKVQYNTTDKWHYDGIGGQTLKYWDLGAAEYSFFAVTPASATLTSTGGAENMALTLTGNKAPADESDWLVAHTLRTMTTPKDDDRLQPAYTFPAITNRWDVVPLCFHRLMSSVVVNLKSTKDVTVKSIKITFPDGSPIQTAARYSPAFTASSPFSAYTYSATRSELGGKKTEAAVSLAAGGDYTEMYRAQQIPQSFDKSATADVELFTFTVTIQTSDDRVFTSTLVTDHSEWQSARQYVYNLTLQPDSDAKIELTTTVQQWGYGGKVDHEAIDW